MKYGTLITACAVLFAAIMLPSCAPDTSGGIPLEGSWQYAPGNPDDTPADAGKHAYRPLAKLSSLERLVPGGRGTVWLKREFCVPDRLAARDLSVYLGTILPVDRTYLNGVFIGGYGEYPSNDGSGRFFSDWNRVRVYPLPSPLVKSDGNELLVKIYVNYEGAVNGTLFVGTREAVERVFAEGNFARFHLNLIITFILLAIGVYLLAVYLLNISIKENLYYALTCLLFISFSVNFYITRLPGDLDSLISYTLFQKLVFGTSSLSLYFLLRFSVTFLAFRETRTLRAIFLTGTVGPALAIYLLPDYGAVVAYAKLLISLSALVTIASILVMTLLCIKAKNEKARILLIGFIPFTFCILFDVYHALFNITDQIYLSGIGISGYIIATGFGIANTVVRYYMHVKELDIALHRSEERYRGVVERNFDVIYTMNRQGELTYASPAITRISGYPVEELLGVGFLTLIPNRDLGKVRAIFRRLVKGETPDTQEIEFIGKEGNKLIMELALSPIVEDGAITGIQGIARNITDRKRAQYALALEKERLAVTLDSIAEAVIATDTDGGIITMNRVAEDLTGIPSRNIIGRPISELLMSVDSDSSTLIDFNLDRMRSSGDRVDAGIQRMVFRKDARERYFASSAAPIRSEEKAIVGYVIVLRDVTDDIIIQDEILKVKKLESMGVLAGGIAHDFNNILTAILGNISLARLNLPSDPGMASDILADAEKAVVEAEGLTRQLLTFSRGGAPVKTVSTVEDIIKDSARFVLRGSRVRVRFDFLEGLRPVNIDKGQFSQVIQNLVINADQAMPDGGEIVIRARNIGPDEAEAAGLLPTRCVEISVVDTGQGIEPQNITKIFDPYFTTKKNGTGLGLASSYSIIKKHSGAITVESDPGKGSRFRIFLPCHEGHIQAVEKNGKRLYRGSGRILVMDDDSIVRGTLCKMLEHLGFSTMPASDGEEAVELYRAARDAGMPFLLAILDLTIPGGMGGKETMAMLRDIDPGVLGLVSSGYSNDDVMANCTAYGFRGVIAKPYTLEDLSSKMSDILGRSDQDSAL